MKLKANITGSLTLTDGVSFVFKEGEILTVTKKEHTSKLKAYGFKEIKQPKAKAKKDGTKSDK